MPWPSWVRWQRWPADTTVSRAVPPGRPADCRRGLRHDYGSPAPGTQTKVETRSAPPLIGGRYRIDGMLGEGGMARVFDAFDERLERPVAVKILRSGTQALPGMRQRFQQEALIAARLVHPHIVAVLDFGEDRTSSYLVMERLPGSTLRDEIVARGPLPTQRVMDVMAETLGALEAAHKFGVLHRDIKPGNILLQEDGHTKITDFGIAKSSDIRLTLDFPDDDMTKTGVVLGTPGYLAPERRSGQPATVQSDLYSVGAVMVETLTGRRIAPGAAATEGLPRPLRDVARRALAADPRDRFGSASEMLRALQLHAAEPSPVIPPTYRLGSRTATTPEPFEAPQRGPASVLTPPCSARPRPTPVRARLRRARLAAVASLTLAALVLMLEGGSRPTGTFTSAAKHHVARPETPALTQNQTQPEPQAKAPTPAPPTDAVSSAIAALATSLAGDGLPGDGALAHALEATAQQLGASHQSSAQQVLSLARVLLDDGAITSGQYQDVMNVLQPTGVAVARRPTTPSASLQDPFFQRLGHGHDRGDGG
jgi:eukaryotic-like serine/threonine-protein kinase